MKRQLPFLLLTALAAVSLAGCSGDDSNNDNGGGNNPPPPPPPPVATSFTDFVHQQLAATSDTTQPVDINDLDFTFPDDDNPAAFDDVVGTP